MEKLLAMKISRLDKKFTTLRTEGEKKQALDLIRKYINDSSKTHMNIIYLQHPAPKTMQDAVTNKLEYACGFIDEVDEDYIYCRIYESKVDQIKNWGLEAACVFLMIANPETEERTLKHLCRINITLS